MHSRLPALATAITILLLTAACATLGGSTHSRGLLFGQVSSEHMAPMRVYIHQPGKMHWGPFDLTAQVRRDGTFVLRNVRPGAYYLGGVSDGVNIYSLSRRQGKLIELQPGQIASLGAYHITGSSQALREGGTLDLTPREHPDELELLERLSASVAGSEWATPVRRRLDEVRRAQFDDE